MGRITELGNRYNRNERYFSSSENSEHFAILTRIVEDALNAGALTDTPEAVKAEVEAFNKLDELSDTRLEMAFTRKRS